ncbi:putative oxidoreductase YvaA [Hartmannibacter diazotrophicus]|uniref:Putative oxidoreductase YvaA n=1 Tax=Hartmannibacter diazotrophicus TaxID=1482074 RepID=A0A2C9D4L8_9HYPH|nr:oxidoreductase [Hartmannibacter diazotrophicus]SON55272.1 putative oxidoreductase YvaA [Hartmannibacter diazotrophicus]
MPELKVGLIGFGLAGSVFHAPLIASEPRFELAAVATSRTLPAEFARAETVADPLALIADPAIDLVVIASPNASHAPLARAALMAGKHVVVDKPFTIDVREADALIDLARLKERHLSVFQNRRWDGNFLTVRQLLDEGAIGEVRYCEIHYDRFRPELKAGWRETLIPGAGTLYNLGPHLLDQALCLFGKPRSVLADIAIQREGAEVDDYVHIVLDYGRLRVVLHASTLVPKEGPRLIAHGKSESLYQFGMDPQEPQLAAGLRPGQPGWGEAEDVSVVVGAGESERTMPVRPGAYECFYRAVAASILDGAPPPVTLDDAHTLMTMIEAARRSAVEGRKIALA